LSKNKRKQEPIFSTLEEIDTRTTTIPKEQLPVITAEDMPPTEPQPVTTLEDTPPTEPVITTEHMPSTELQPDITTKDTPSGEPQPFITIEDMPPAEPQPAVTAADMLSTEAQPTITDADKPSVNAQISDSVEFPDFSFVHIPSGTFIMGSPEYEPGRNIDETQHEVTLSKGFYMQTTPVTQRQWKSVMGFNPSGFSRGSDDHPVENVSWYDCQQFIKSLNRIEKHTYRLPTEAEWEYACRAGSPHPCAEGEIIELFCGYDYNLDIMGWYCGNSGRTTHPVAQKSPNSWGLYDMHGNVLEWCQDWYTEYSATPQKDPTGPVIGSTQVVRGGSWFANAKNCRSGSRFYWTPNSKSDFIGLRLVKEKN